MSHVLVFSSQEYKFKILLSGFAHHCITIVSRLPSCLIPGAIFIWNTVWVVCPEAVQYGILRWMAYWKQPGRVDLVSDFEGNNCQLTQSFLRWGFRKNLFQFSSSVNFVFICTTVLTQRIPQLLMKLFALTARRLNSNLKSTSSYYVRPDVQFSSVQLLSCVQRFGTPWTAARQTSLSITNSRSLLKLMSIESAMPSNHLILCCPLLLLPSVFPSIRIFSNESVLHIRWQSIGVSASSSVPPMNIQDWFPLGLTGWISLQSKGLSRVFSNTTVQKHQFFGAQLSLWSNSHIHT